LPLTPVLAGHIAKRSQTDRTIDEETCGYVLLR
jgi:hypothetical protein